MRKGLFLLAPAVFLFAARADATCPNAMGTVDAAVTEALKPANFSPVGYCIVAISGSTLVKRCGGVTNTNTNAPVLSSTLFNLASVTKTMTGTLLALRMQQGLVHLTDLVSSYITLPSNATFTIGSLAHHMSGLQEYPYFIGNNETEFYNGVYGCIFDPSCWNSAANPPYNYSNYGFDILGDILGDHGTTPATWPEANYNELMLPLGMSLTATKKQFDALFPGYFASHRAWGHNAGPTPVASPVEPDAWIAAAGGLYTSIDDMVVWLKYNMGSISTFQSLLPSIRTGLGWNIHDPICATSGNHFFKPGGLSGFSTYIGYDSYGARGVVVMLNNDASIAAATDMGQFIMKHLP